MKKAIVVMAVLLLGVPVLSHGFGVFRRGSVLISVGDTKAEVLAKCGSPDLIEDEGYSTEETQYSQTRTGKSWR